MQVGNGSLPFTLDTANTVRHRYYDGHVSRNRIWFGPFDTRVTPEVPK